jgi:hypothetical protein
MANSRSNIYPVQLQGAELNLNKLDAEIKQYSGFNKNNAPFVGGCLSNIFTKDETIEGATSKNTYIAPNGDVYRVNTEGLWKNEEKLVDYSGKKFYKVEELEFQFPANTIYIQDTNVYITAELGDSGYDVVLNAYNPFQEKWEKINIFTSFNHRYKIFLDAKYCKNDDSMIVAVSYSPNWQGSALDPRWGTWLMVYKLDAENEVSKVYEYQVNNAGYRYCPVHLELFNGNEGYITFLQNAIWVGRDTWEGSIGNGNHFGYNFTFDMTGNVEFTGFLDMPETIPSNFLYYSNYSGNEPHNCAGTYYKYTEDSFYCDDSNFNVFVASGKYHVSKGKLYIDEYNAYVTTSQNSTSRRVFEKYGALINYSKYALCDYETFGINGIYHYAGAVVGGCVLYNNEVISGVCTPSGTVLVSEWNTVEDVVKTQFAYQYEGSECNIDAICIFKTFHNKWYKLVEAEPSLTVINNQVICNVDFYNNAYDIERNKLLLFAPAWNNRTPGRATEDYTGYLATAINEYALENNASLIINPVQITRRKALSASDNSTAYLADTLARYIKFNVYCGTTEVNYLWSGFIGIDRYLIDEDLSGLPFPTNTDGNVQYSPSLFAEEKGKYGNLVFISEGGTAYKLMTYDNKAVMSYFLSTAVEGLQDFFTIQGQLYGILDNQIYNFSIVNEIANRGDFIVSVEGLQFVGNTPYEALFFSKTNRCLYSFTGANVLNDKQFVDKISEVRNYKYNPATQSIFLITDIGVIVYSLFGIYQIEFANCQDMYLLNNGVILTDNEGTFKYVKYYKEETTDDYAKENIQLETMFYGMNNQTATINDCLYMRIFSEEHEEGDLEVSATTLSLEGRMTEKTTFKIKASDWDTITHTIYLRYQPKEQRGLGISFSINSPFKIASLSIGSQADAILIDKVSKGAINAPQITSNNVEW